MRARRKEAWPGTPDLTVLVVPGGGRRVRALRISYKLLRGVVPVAALVAAVSLLVCASWAYLAVRASQTEALEGEVARLVEQEARVADLARGLAEVEAAYDGIRDLFGVEAVPDAADLWLPPVPSSRARDTGPANRDLPVAWPLTEPGFVTQPLLAGAGADHPGIDIAVPADSYVRAAGNGLVVETGHDGVYGNYIVVNHQEGYQTRYAHASALLASEGESVRRNEVIALSGSTGQSTAPHLHFEILREGEPVDPLALVTQP